MSERVAFLGLGIMGSRMAANLHKAGFELTVWNRTQATAEQFCAANAGTKLAHTPAEAAAEADVVLSMVVDGPPDLAAGDRGDRGRGGHEAIGV